MANNIENAGVDNTLLSLNTRSINEEGVDDKVYVSETVIFANSFELQDHMKWHGKIEYEASTILNNIKAELPSSEGQYNVINDNVKIEEGISTNNIKIEVDNGLLYCEHCQAYYDDYCIKCGMLQHILNRNAQDNSDNRAQDELPNGILKIQPLFEQCGILALKVIPEGVIFGPFIGICRTENAWRVKGGKFVVDKDKLHHLNWMQYINPARNAFEGNLIVLQCEDYLYYRSTRQIQPDEELLVYFGEEFEGRLNGNVEVDFIPTTEHLIKDIFACTFCCLGFSSSSYLVKHKTTCLGDAGSNFLFEDLAQCPFCKIHFGQKEYLKHHFAYCSTRNVRTRTARTLSNQMTTVNVSKTRRNPLYKCELCNYSTKYKADLKKHNNKQHYKVRKSKCGICYRRFETTECLKLHIENSHISVGPEKDQSHSRCDYMNAHIKVELSNSQDHTKRFKCSLCNLRTQHKKSLINHMKTKHAKEFNFKCESCEFKTNSKHYLDSHIKSKHLKEFDFKCDSCEYRSNQKAHLQRHIRTKHLMKFNYKCGSCEYKANYKEHLKVHIKTKHLKQFDLKCDLCEFRTNYKIELKMHIKSKHLKEFDFKCDSCEFKTNRKDRLESHVKIKHMKELNFICDLCELKTYRKDYLERHIKTKHLKEFNLKCDSCDYRTNQKQHLECHIKAKHLMEFNYQCDSCEFRTNYKYSLKLHVKSKHLKEFEFKCDSCEFKTNHRSELKIHVKRKHFK